MKDFINITKELGERILAEKNFGEVRVLHVDFTKEHSPGYSELTPAETEYPVIVHYINVHSQPAKYTKVYRDLSAIINALENIAYEVDDD